MIIRQLDCRHSQSNIHVNLHKPKYEYTCKRSFHGNSYSTRIILCSHLNILTITHHGNEVTRRTQILDRLWNPILGVTLAELFYLNINNPHGRYFSGDYLTDYKTYICLKWHTSINLGSMDILQELIDFKNMFKFDIYQNYSFLWSVWIFFSFWTVPHC